NVDNLKLRRFRDVFGSEWRNDRRDAKMLAKMLKLKDHMDAEEEKAFRQRKKKRGRFYLLTFNGQLTKG
ncbi:MAG: hypothetical protein Q8P40_12075, partial [Nitrospirota bacterium]|nr:hypothetical protein [Nitrospirota bacterium]